MTHFLARRFWFSWVAVVLLASFLRLYQLTTNPPSLYWEEVAVGYDAYSILQTGKDFHGQSWPIVAFESFGDWKPSLYFYAVVPAMAIFGLSELAVRLPSVIAGLAIVIGTGVLAQFALRDRVSGRRAQLIGMAVAAISPWAIIFSRGGWEANLATALILWGVNAFLFFIDRAVVQGEQPFQLKREERTVGWLILAAFCLCLSMYAYHSARLVAPMVGIGLLGVWWAKAAQARTGLIDQARHFIATNGRFVIVGLGVTLFLLAPLLVSLTKVETQQRFQETNIFADLELLKRSQSMQLAAGNTPAARILYHRYVIYSQEVLRNFLQHFSLSFLFLNGDVNLRHSVQFMGQLYHIEFVFLVLALWQLLRHRRAIDWFLVWWMVVGVFTAALTKATPHALRILPTLPVWLVFITSGICAVYELSDSVIVRMQSLLPWLKRSAFLLVLTFALLLAYGAELTMFWRFYTQLYPKLYGGAFNDGDKQMVQAVDRLATENPELPVVIMRSRGRPSVYYWFYTQTDPREVQIANATAPKDQGEFLAFKNVSFPLSTTEISSPAIVAIEANQYSDWSQQSLDFNDPMLTIIYDQNNQPVWVVLRY